MAARHEPSRAVGSRSKPGTGMAPSTLGRQTTATDTAGEGENRPAASSPAGSMGIAAPTDAAGSDAEQPVSVGVTRGWSAEVMGVHDAELPTVGGPAMLVSRTPAQTTITGMVGQTGGSLTIGLETFEVGKHSAHDFNLGFQLQRYRCISQQVVVTLTQVEPRPRGTFSGPVRCEDLAERADPMDATVSGEIAG